VDNCLSFFPLVNVRYFLFFYLQLLIMITPLICSNFSYFAMFVDCQFNSADHNWKCIVNMTRLYLNLCTSVLGGVRVARSLAFCVVLLVDRCFSFLPFLFWPLCCFFLLRFMDSDYLFGIF